MDFGYFSPALISTVWAIKKLDVPNSLAASTLTTVYRADIYPASNQADVRSMRAKCWSQTQNDRSEQSAADYITEAEIDRIRLSYERIRIS